MAYVNPTYYDRFRYTLQHASYGTQIITEPEGYDEDEKEYSRHKTYHGIFAKFSNNLKFVGDGRDYINNVRRAFGINAKIRMVKEYKDADGVWQRAYSGFLAMDTWSDEENKVSIKFNSGGLESILKARFNDKFEIERTDSVYGDALPELILKFIRLHGRRVFLKTQFNVLTSANQANVSVETNAGNTRNQSVGLPLNMFSQSHDLAHSVIPQSHADENNGTTGMMFYANNDRVRNLDIDLNFNFEVYFQQYENVQWCRYRVYLTTYENGVNYNVKNKIELAHLSSESPGTVTLPSDYDAPYPSFTKDIAINWQGQIELLEDESLAIEINLKSDMYFDNNAGVRAYARDIEGYLNIEEDSSYPETTAPGILAHDLMDRLVQIVTGKEGLFKSDYFGRTDLGYESNGPGAFALASHGHWIRGFTKDDDLYKPFSTSIKETFQGLAAPYNVGLGIERIGFKERIIVEDKKYFYNPNVTIRIGKEDENGVFQYAQVQKVKREEYKDGYFSSINIGSEKGGDYEEVMGLEETNTSSNFTTPIEALTNEYTRLSKQRYDSYGEEIIRRHSILTHPTTDQSGDKHIWWHDAKPQFGLYYELKRQADVLSATPIGMFSPETSYNFIYSPVNMLKNHGWVINAGLRHNQNGDLVFGTSRGKSQVTMQVIGDNAYAENENFPVADLETARFVPEKVTFESEIDVEMQRIIEGTTVILGTEIPNIYGSVEFKNEDGELERGFILSVKPNKEGVWEVLRSSRTV